MAQIIAGIYELDREIGAGGGGIVYIGRHLRLNKKVVLKADKRTLKTGVDKLRREVDLLKNLSHTYIPQVYDFVQEDGVVYTVMDYIEGESLDKLIGRQQLPTQPEVIKWACQLLEALSYLHSRPPHGILHGDIKPANIMLKPNGDICLIDYNIALALGEDGAVKVGFSRGYASPEHYGADYVIRNKQVGAHSLSHIKTTKWIKTHTEQVETEVDSDGETTAVEESLKGLSGVGNSVDANKGVLLDIRSDIYSLGATLYHLLSGQRPAQDAREVKPLEADVCSEAVAAIIQKAMSPFPEERYQTAEEMLSSFKMLHSCDIRVRRHKRHIRMAIVGIAGMFLIGGFCTVVGLKQLEQMQKSLTLAEYSANTLAKGDVSGAVEQALQAIPIKTSIWNGPVMPQAQKALTDALGVYDLSEGYKMLDVLELPGAPFDIKLSPDGTYVAVIYAYEVAVYQTEDMQQIITLPIQKSALSDCVFTDETHLIYAGDTGIAMYDLRQKEIIWTGVEVTTLALSADGSVVAAVNRNDDKAFLYQTSDGELISEVSFQGQHMDVAVNDIFADFENNIFALNDDGSLLAVSFSNGGLYILDVNNPSEDIIIYEESDYRHFAGGFCGADFAFIAEKSGESVFSVVDVEKAVFLGGYTSQNNLMLQAGEQGIYLASGNILTQIDTVNFTEKEIAYTEDASIISFEAGKEYTLVGTDDNAFLFYDSGTNLMSKDLATHNCEFVVLAGKYAIIGNRSEPTVRVMKLENHEEEQLLHYDAHYEHDEARISHDEKTIMLFGYKSFRIYDLSGNIVADVKLPEAEQIYDQQFIRSESNSWLEVIWYDGTRRCYSAQDGKIISEEKKEEPQKDLYEEFFTNKYRIESSLHEVPKVYELDTDTLVCNLESDDYLTYVTQSGEYLITEYINTTGERYGILLNDKLEKLAYLPGLCDVIGDRLLFDYKSGNLRQSRLFSLQELIALGEKYITK